MEPSNNERQQQLKPRPNTGTDIEFKNPIRKRRRQSKPSVAMAAMVNLSILLLCAKICHPFTITPNALIAMKKSYQSPAATYNSKESDIDEEESWEWDGVVIEGAHDSEFESVDGDADAFVPSMNFMSMANSVTSPALTAAAGGGSGAKSEFDPLKNAGIIHRISMEKEGMSEDDLLEMGGDPAFLDDVEEDREGLKEEIDDSHFFGWDGEVDEDAHLD